MEEDEIATKVEVEVSFCWAVIDTAAYSIWMLATWYQNLSGIAGESSYEATAADGHRVNAAGVGWLKFSS